MSLLVAILAGAVPLACPRADGRPVRVAALVATGRALQRSEHKAVILIGDLAALAAAVVTSLWLWSITAFLFYGRHSARRHSLSLPGASSEIPQER